MDRLQKSDAYMPAATGRITRYQAHRTVECARGGYWVMAVRTRSGRDGDEWKVSTDKGLCDEHRARFLSTASVNFYPLRSCLLRA